MRVPGCGTRHLARLWLQDRHGLSTPSNITSVNNAPEPPLEHIATSAPAICVLAQVAAQLLDAADHALQHLARRAGVAVRHDPAVGGDRVLPAGLDGASHHEVAAFALAAEAEGLELADDLERERIVELADVDVGGPQARRRGTRPPRLAARPCRSRDRRADCRPAPTSAGSCTTVPPLSLLPPSTNTGLPGASAARSARVSTKPHPPSEAVAQSRRWNGSATMRLSRMSCGVNGPRPW